MKSLLMEYFKIIGLTFTGLVFGFSFFILFLNIYHNKEISKTYEKNESDDIVIKDITTKVEQTKANVSQYNPNAYFGNDNSAELSTLQSSLQICASKFEDETIIKLLNKKSITIKDVYRLQKYYQNNILSECVVKQTYSLTESGNQSRYHFESLKNLSPFIKMNADNLLKSTNYVNRIIENNSNYYISSDYAKDNFIEFTRDNYNEIVNAYNNAADYILYLSDWFKTMSGGVQ